MGLYMGLLVLLLGGILGATLLDSAVAGWIAFAAAAVGAIAALLGRLPSAGE